MDAEWKKLVKEAQGQGWRVQIGGKGQLKLIPKDPYSEIVVLHGTPPDHRAFRNAIARMRRAGLVWPPKRKGNR